jgi:hypothetical protein
MLNNILGKKIGDKTIYEILKKIQNSRQRKHFGLNNATIFRDYKSIAISSYLKEMMSKDQPFFIGRIGGSDYEVLNKFFNNNKIFDNPKKCEKYTNIVRNFNGYFDFSNDKKNFIKYIEVIINSYENTDCVSYCNKNIIDQFNDETFLDDYIELFNKVVGGKVAFDYTFFESILPFLSSFKEWGSGKKILFVSPFSESIEYQFRRKDDLINSYKFPDFKLVTYNTNITYNNKNDSKESLCVVTESWHEECEKITNGISTIEFDIAFLSCGSYAMPIGSFIKRNLNKKAIYLGGILNVIFNIYGKRYDEGYFNKLVNLEYQIEPFENRSIAKIKGGRHAPGESLNAYFGGNK